MNIKKPALGRGLGAILPGSDTEINKEYNSAISGNNKLPIEQIEANPYQPRTAFEEVALSELSESIKIHGIIQPLTVRRLGNNVYQLISGERRLKASKLAGLKEVPAYIIDTDNQGMMEMALIENIQRENLNAIEIAISYKRLIEECQLKQEELAHRVSKERSTVTNYIRLLKLPPEIQAGIRDSVITMGHAKALISIEHVENQLMLYKEIISKQHSVRKTEALVRDLNENKRISTTKPNQQLQLPLYIRNLQDQLSTHFETKVNFKTKGDGKGEIVIPYLSNDDLNRILEIIG